MYFQKEYKNTCFFFISFNGTWFLWAKIPTGSNVQNRGLFCFYRMVIVLQVFKSIDDIFVAFNSFARFTFNLCLSATQSRPFHHWQCSFYRDPFFYGWARLMGLKDIIRAITVMELLSIGWHISPQTDQVQMNVFLVTLSSPLTCVYFAKWAVK